MDNRILQLAGLQTYSKELNEFIDLLAEVKAEIELTNKGI